MTHEFWDISLEVSYLFAQSNSFPWIMPFSLPWLEHFYRLLNSSLGDDRADWSILISYVIFWHMPGLLKLKCLCFSHIMRSDGADGDFVIKLKLACESACQ